MNGQRKCARVERRDLVIFVAGTQRLKRLDTEIDSKANDKKALSHEEREKREAELASALLAVERDESALV
jgi:hypothetical protein